MIADVTTLHLDGLRLLPVDTTAQLETLAWTDPAVAMPDADMRVLVWVREPDGATDWWAAWWDGAAGIWRDAAHGGQIGGDVVRWAEVMGPQA